VILVDANLLLYAKFSDMPQHDRTVRWLEQAVRDGVRIGLPWASLLAFVRISTNARVYARPLAVSQAWEQVEEWLALPGAWVPQPTEEHRLILGRLLNDANVSGNLVTDAHLAALALEHGLELCTADSDFARFPGVRWRNPLVEGVREARARYSAVRKRA
jgi:toxin-antitoxin system PIN domain toxin